MNFRDALDGAIVAGFALTVLVPMFVERLKIWFPSFFENRPTRTKLVALAVGTLVGSLYLFFAFPVAGEPDLYMAIFLRIGSAFAWSFTAPWFYDMQKRVAAKSAEKAIDNQMREVEMMAVMGGQIDRETGEVLRINFDPVTGDRLD